MDFTILMKHQFLSFGFAQVKPHGVLGTAEGEKDLAPMAPVEVPSTNCHSNSGSMGVLQWLWDFHVVINYHYILSFITIINYYYYYYLSFEGSIAEKIAIVSSVSRLVWWTLRASSSSATATTSVAPAERSWANLKRRQRWKTRGDHGEIIEILLGIHIMEL